MNYIAPGEGDLRARPGRDHRENHQMMLDHYSQTKAVLVSTDEKRLGFF